MLIKADLARYFNFFSANPAEIFTGALLDSHAKDVIPGKGVLFGTQDELISTVTEGTTLHVTLNQTSLLGRRNKHVEACRVLCVDLDHETTSEEIKNIVKTYSAQLVVESSPGKFHIYWRVSPTIGLENWQRYQLALAQGFGGDKQLDALAKTIRVPGVPRVTKSGTAFIPRIKFAVAEPVELDRAAIEALFPWINAKYEEACADKAKARAALKRTLKAVRRGDTNIPKPSGNGRNASIYDGVKLWAADVSNHSVNYENALAIGTSINAQFEEGIDQNELEKTVESALEHGEELRSKRMHYALKLLNGGSEVYTNGHANGHVNGHAEMLPAAVESGSPPYPYDYNEPMLHKNRFTDMAVPARCLQRFGELLVRVDKNLYAFNTRTKTWCLQSGRYHAELAAFAEIGALDTLEDPEFLTEMCLTDEGAVSRSKLKRAQEKFLSLSLHSRVCSKLLNMNEVREATGDLFDAEPELLYCANGVLDMRSGALREAAAGDYLLRRTGASYEPEARCPKWQQFLAQVFSENDSPADMILFMQELFGYSISGCMEEQKIFCHHGSGCNGKSKVLRALKEILGGYTDYIDPDEMTRSKNTFSKAFERFGAKLEGKRAAIIDDIDVETVWNEAFVKNVTGNSIRARAEYEQSRVIANRCKMHLGLNVAPTPQGENFGILRRICLIPYGRRFKPTVEENMRIDALIVEERSGILNWAIDGYRRWKSQGKLREPVETLLAIEEYKEDHFKMENAIRALYEPADYGFEFATDIAIAVQKYTRSERRPTPDEVRDAIKEAFNLKPEKCWHPEKKNAFRGFKIAPLKFETPLLDTVL